MITKEKALKLLKKYGYESKENHPYLYIKDNKIGINYSYIDDTYGIVERTALFGNEGDMDLFLKRYQWFKINGKAKKVHMELYNYEVTFPKVYFERNNHVMTDFEMFNIDTYDAKEKKNQKLSHTKRLLNLAEELMDRYYLKKADIIHYIEVNHNKEEELKRYYINLQDLVNKYNNKKWSIEYQEDNSNISITSSLEDKVNVKLAKAKQKVPKEDEVLELIDDIWQLNKNLELNPTYLEALKKDDDIDEELRLVVTKIDYMKDLLNKRRSFFKENLKKKFKNIDESSTYKSVYDSHFEDKITSFINDKYNGFKEIDIFKACEYLNDFTGTSEYDIEKNIKRCSLKDKKAKEEKTFDEVYENLIKQFNKLTKKEQAALIVYSSLYRELFDTIMSISDYDKISLSKLNNLLNITDGYNKLIEDSYTRIKKLLGLDINAKINKEIFGNFDYSSKEKFLSSVLDNIKIISNINSKMVLKDKLKLYFGTNDFDTLGQVRFIRATNNIDSYLNINKKDYKVIVAYIKPEINILLAPKYIKLPSVNAKEQLIELIDESNVEVFIDPKDVTITKDVNDVIFTKFKTNLVNEKNYSYVDDVSVNYKTNINKVIIERK